MKTIYYSASSLDGFIAEEDDNLDWLLRYEGTYEGPEAEQNPMSEGGGYERFYAGVGALVMGAVTYEWLLGHLDVAGGGGEWPYAGKPCWVLTSRELPRVEGDGVDVRFANAPVADLYDEMAAAADRGALWVVGGGDLASQFAGEGLLDELHVTVVPVALGSGKPLFSRRLPNPPMQLLGTRAFKSGMVELRYALRPAAAN